MTTRRELLIALSALASLPALAQQDKRVRRIGYFIQGSLQSSATLLAAFREGMSALQWIDGRDYVIDARYANGDVKALPGLAAELVASQPDLLLAGGDEDVRQLNRRTKTIPIVFAIGQDPVGTGVVASLQRPGGNATGLATLARELAAKRLQLIKEAFPRVAHVVVLFDPSNLGSVAQLKEIESASPRMAMQITPIELRQPADIEPAFKRGAALGAQAYMVTQSGVITSQRRKITDHTIGIKVPAFFSDDRFVEAGGLMSYSASFQDNYRRAAGYVDKILKGAKPGDLPIEQPTKFELVINMKTAKAMGLTIPPSVLLQASRVIE